MSWILEHIQFIIGIAAAIAYFINKARPTDEKPEARKARETDPEAAERTRRIREEIMRKKMGRTAETPRSGPVVVAAPAGHSLPPPLMAPRPASGSMGGLREKLDAKLAQARAREAAERAAFENEERIEREERQTELLRREERKRAELQATLKQAERIRMEQGRNAKPQPASASLLGELRDPASARRAIVLREVLGAPVALR